MISEDKEHVRALLAAIVESSDDAIISKTLDGVITSWNRSAQRVFGYTAEEAIGQSVMMLIPSDLQDEEGMILARIKRGERIDHFETVRRRKDGVELDISLTISPIKDINNRVIGASKIARDITERKSIERRVREFATQLSLALRASHMGDWSWDTATDVVTLSERAAEIFGIPPGPQMTWTQLRELLHEEDRELARLKIEQAIADRSDYDIEYRVSHPAGRMLWVAAKGQAIYDENEQVKGMLGIVQDITELKLEKTLLEEERETLEILNRVGQLLNAELDLNKLVQALTDAATEITGAQVGSFFYNIVDARGETNLLYTITGVPREDYEHFPMPRATDLFGPTFRGEGVVRIADVNKDPRYGRNSPYFGMPRSHLTVRSYLAVPVVLRSGEVIGGLFFGHPIPDIFTERHERIVTGMAGQAAISIDNARLYESAQKARGEAEKANRLKDEFLATVSHELRTPLNAIFGWARILRGGKLDGPGIAHAVEIIERNARAQGQIIEDILDVSRIITGKISLDVAPIEVAAVIETTIDSLRPTAEARGIQIQPMLNTKSNLILGDAGRLQQIFWNLISNAIKFTPKGGRIQIVLERIDSMIEVRMTDTGQGISREFLPYVFDRFRQADSTTTREYGGLGLGLAIVRHLTELHGGSVAAESAGEGLGATFIVRFPLAIMRKEKTAQDRPQSPQFPQPVTGETTMEFGDELKGVKVLVVDDEADARELLLTVLHQCGAEVRAASSTPQGLEMLKEWQPDVLVSDIGMPGKDGYALIRDVRALSSEQGGEIPAIALTAYARSEDRLKALRSGFQTHVAKPVEPAELAATIAGLARSPRRPL